MKIYPFPDEETLDELQGIAPEYSYRNNQPYALVAEGYLRDSQCHEIIDMFLTSTPYKLEHCNAWTREKLAPMAGPLALVEDFALGMNKMYWQYDIEPSGAAWLQTYGADNDYQKHTDSYAGQSRKLTAVVMLDDPDEYRGGILEIQTWPQSLRVPNEQGTIVIFQAFHQHRVTPIVTGLRRTVNMGFWGPQFR